MNFFIWAWGPMIVFFIVIFLLQAWTNHMHKQRTKELVALEEKRIESFDKMRLTLINAKADVVDQESLKRWMAQTIKSLNEHGDKMEELFKVSEQDGNGQTIFDDLEDENNG